MIEALRSAKNKIKDSKNWTYDAFARNEDGISCSVFSKDACMFCAFGAILLACQEKDVNPQQTLAYFEQQLEMQSITQFNDSSSHAEVLAAFSKAIKNKEQDL